MMETPKMSYLDQQQLVGFIDDFTANKIRKLARILSLRTPISYQVAEDAITSKVALNNYRMPPFEAAKRVALEPALIEYSSVWVFDELRNADKDD